MRKIFRCKEIQAQLRYCEFNCADYMENNEAMSEILSIKLKLGDDDTLQDDFNVS